LSWITDQTAKRWRNQPQTVWTRVIDESTKFFVDLDKHKDSL